MPVISTSRRTDIPAFHTDWLLGRIERGFCEVLSPYGGPQERAALRSRGHAPSIAHTSISPKRRPPNWAKS
ncbi:DUF1848 family protein [Elusimicrobiota bacterium]